MTTAAIAVSMLLLLLVPAAAALPVIAALVIACAGKTAAYPPGPRESVWKRPRPIEEREGTR